MKLVSMSTLYGGTKAALCCKNSEDATCVLVVSGIRVNNLDSCNGEIGRTLCGRPSLLLQPLSSAVSLGSLSCIIVRLKQLDRCAA